MKASTPASISYELDITIGPLTLEVAGQRVVIADGSDATVLVCIVESGSLIVSRTIIGVLSRDTMLNFRQFIKDGGGVTLGSGMRP